MILMQLIQKIELGAKGKLEKVSVKSPEKQAKPTQAANTTTVLKAHHKKK